MPWLREAEKLVNLHRVGFASPSTIHQEADMKIPFQAETNFTTTEDEVLISQDPDGTFDVATVAFTRDGAARLVEILHGFLADDSWGQDAPPPSTAQDSKPL